MAATRVRLVVEYRNGDMNYLAQYSGEFVKCDGEGDVSALDAAYVTLLQKEADRLHARTEEARTLPAHHD
jgi:hypothetical protein